MLVNDISNRLQGVTKNSRTATPMVAEAHHRSPNKHFSSTHAIKAIKEKSSMIKKGKKQDHVKGKKERNERSDRKDKRKENGERQVRQGSLIKSQRLMGRTPK
jgi:hypothetical protein